MSRERWSFDEYGRKARVLPAILVGAPALSLLLFIDVTIPTKLVSGIALLALLTFASQLLLHRGRTEEARLLREWGGFPTTLMLRHSAAGSASLRARRRSNVERVSGINLPSAHRERTRPLETNEEYSHAVKLCIDKVRNDNPNSRLLQIENIHYGFRRNMRAGKQVGLTVAILSLLASCALAIFRDDATAGIAAATINLISVAAWAFGVNDPWVRDQADKYADRFFRALED